MLAILTCQQVKNRFPLDQRQAESMSKTKVI